MSVSEAISVTYLVGTVVFFLAGSVWNEANKRTDLEYGYPLHTTEYRYRDNTTYLIILTPVWFLVAVGLLLYLLASSLAWISRSFARLVVDAYEKLRSKAGRDASSPE